MNYILTNIVYQDSPVVNGDGTFTQYANITIGIEGDIYGFTQMQRISVGFTTTDTVASIQASIVQAANDCISRLYNS